MRVALVANGTARHHAAPDACEVVLTVGEYARAIAIVYFDQTANESLAYLRRARRRHDSVIYQDG